MIMTMTMRQPRIIRTYTELIQLPTFEERYKYLKLDGKVGNETFGFDRIFNQLFYKSKEWERIRNQVIIRDTGFSDSCCDLGVPGYEIYGPILIHHMNPIDISDIRDSTEYLLNQEYLISTTRNTHNAIHYGTKTENFGGIIERTRNDTCPWKER